MIAFACAQCGASVQAEDRLIGAFTNCPACGQSVPVPLPDVTAEATEPLAAPPIAPPVLLAEPFVPEPSPFAQMDESGGGVISSRVAERAYGFYGRDALGFAITSLVLACIPCFSIASPFLALVGVVLSINGIVKCSGGRSVNGMGYSIAGLVVSLLAGGFWGLVLLANLVRAGAR
ncbi:MAG: hypothetical protein JNM56_29545 [Planctomycetia bacterium]|nr:hypothetical protein [Planctomycetia bacterium]